ncbi:MAG: hypothetical protein LH606_06655 [Cytophagaceae bacterium]|nr:hypothetical protein [Cytophagaceae bacterium]
MIHWPEDTPLEIRRLQARIIQQKTPEARLRMACEMADLGQQAVRDRLRRRNPGWTEGQIRAGTFREIYRDDFTAEKLEEIAESMRVFHDKT